MKATVLFIAILGLAMLVLPMVSMNIQMDRPPGEAAEVHSPNLPQGNLESGENGAEGEGEGTALLMPEDASSFPTAAPDAVGEIGAPEQEGSEAEGGTGGMPLDEYGEAEFTSNGVSSFRILDESTGEIHQVSLRDYVRGAVAAEMPVSFHEEALKAQAVAAHTYALYNHRSQQENPDPALRGADFTADPGNRRGYMTKETALAFYGENGEAYWQSICGAADSVLAMVMEYDDEPIVAAYHAISAGYTEDAGNVWIQSVPYLQPVESEGDQLAPDYESRTRLTAPEVREALLAAYPEMELEEDPGEWFQVAERSGSGYITRAEVGGVDLHGSEIRTLFDLRSHNLDISYSDAGFVFTAYGYGHGVGLSQYGADFLARQGYTYDEILRTYYTDVTLKRINLEGI